MGEEVAIVADPGSKGYGFVKGVYNYISKKKGRDFPVHLVEAVRRGFPDKEANVRIDENVRRKTCVYIHDANKSANWMSDLQLSLNALKYASAGEIAVVLPYMRYSRQDRKDTSRVSQSAKEVAQIISNRAHSGMTIDLHAPQIQGFFDIPFDNLSSSPVVASHLIKRHRELLDNLVLVSPDLGGVARTGGYQGMFESADYHTDIAVCNKIRGVDGEVKRIDIIGRVKGKNCLILDDIIGTGETMKVADRALRSKGAKKVSVWGTHGFFIDGYEGFDQFDSVFTGDTLYNENHDNLEVISMMNYFGEAIYRNIVGESLSDLFKLRVGE